MGKTKINTSKRVKWEVTFQLTEPIEAAYSVFVEASDEQEALSTATASLRQIGYRDWEPLHGRNRNWSAVKA